MNQQQYREALTQTLHFYEDKIYACNNEERAEMWRVKRRVVYKLLKKMPKKKALTEKEKAGMRKYYHANKENLSKRAKAYRKQNAEYCKACKQIRIICNVCGKDIQKSCIQRHQRGIRCMQHKAD